MYQKAYKILHWVMALFIIILLVVGTIMADLPDTAANKGFMYFMHKSFGFLVFFLAILRVFWKIKNEKVLPLETLTRFERAASTATHHMLIALIVIMPITGLLATNSCCAPLPFFNLFNVSIPFLYFSEGVTKLLFTIHNIAGKLMIFLILAHIGAALMHHFIKKDGVLKRMLP